ncbi:MAG: hypothetical protein EZS28_018601 [Streblomastix strix]|uniref:Uncharacterized protein n=1 Tax=Streblomastix strix TaxID=222440 RepID=A0A5J4VTB7_9EUKA|nr:MAG: hypothetical protein EZS28_018601 [Streblomastix strix]
MERLCYFLNLEDNTITPPTPPTTVFLIQIASRQKNLIGALATRDIRIPTDSTTPWGINDVVGITLKFPELYAYILLRESKPIVDGLANQIIIGHQYLQDQVKDNDNKFIVQPTSSESITPPVPVAAELITIPLTRITQPLLRYNINEGGINFYKLRNKVIFNIGQYLIEDFMGFVFSNFPEEL